MLPPNYTASFWETPESLWRSKPPSEGLWMQPPCYSPHDWIPDTAVWLRIYICPKQPLLGWPVIWEMAQHHSTPQGTLCVSVTDYVTQTLSWENLNGRHSKWVPRLVVDIPWGEEFKGWLFYCVCMWILQSHLWGPLIQQLEHFNTQEVLRKYLWTDWWE